MLGWDWGQPLPSYDISVHLYDTIIGEQVGGFGGPMRLLWGKQTNYLKLFIAPLANSKCMLAV